MDIEQAREQIRDLERENRILHKQLQRHKKNLAQMEEAKEKNDQFLGKVILELREAQEAAHEANEALEQRVAERTEALAQVSQRPPPKRVLVGACFGKPS